MRLYAIYITGHRTPNVSRVSLNTCTRVLQLSPKNRFLSHCAGLSDWSGLLSLAWSLLGATAASGVTLGVASPPASEAVTSDPGAWAWSLLSAAPLSELAAGGAELSVCEGSSLLCTLGLASTSVCCSAAWSLDPASTSSLAASVVLFSFSEAAGSASLLVSVSSALEAVLAWSPLEEAAPLSSAAASVSRARSLVLTASLAPASTPASPPLELLATGLGSEPLSLSSASVSMGVSVSRWTEGAGSAELSTPLPL